MGPGRAGPLTPARGMAFAMVVLAATMAYATWHGRAGTDPSIRYTLTPVPATADREGLTRVRVGVVGVPEGTTSVRFQMPVWTPGEYRVQNHGRYVRRFRMAGGANLCEHPDPHTWVAKTNGTGQVVIEYEVLNAPPGAFTENVDVRSRHAFYNGAATFVFVAGRTQEPVSLAVTTPPGWRGPITTLKAEEAMAESREPGSGYASRSTTGYRAATYEEMVDAPILVGEASHRTFTESGKPHSIAFFGKRVADPAVHLDTFRAIARAGRDYMGALPYESYTFFLDSGGRGGGLEHANGARIAWTEWMDSAPFGRFMAHEYFHLWNVKRIRPAVLGPFDYITPPKTRNLWFCEGVTEYVAGMLSLRAAILDERTYLTDLARSVTTLANTPARRKVTAEEASLRIWENGRSTGYGGLSVYLKGELVGLCLDLELLRRSDGRFGMRELMRDLMDRHAPPKPGYPEDGLRQAVIRAAGESMGPYYDRLCKTTEELPVAECLRAAGFDLGGDAVRGYWIARDPNAPSAARRIAEAWLLGR